MLQHRYPGVRPFEKNERALFFGREQDIQRVYELLLLEKIVILFGKSGYGKSSLLNAGLIPLLESDEKRSDGGYQPLLVRFKDYQSNTGQSPIQTVLQRLEESVPVQEDAAYLDPFFPNAAEAPRLWYAFKRRSTRQARQFVLIFDQFEEFFSYPAAQQTAFRQQLSELLFIQIPQALRNASDDLPDADFSHLVAPLDIKVLISIRGDRLQLLDTFKDSIPGILHKRYELSALSPQQAEAAIVQPAALAVESGPFVSPPFSFSAAALEALIAELAKSPQQTAKGVEAFQLQIVCAYIENRVKSGAIPAPPGQQQPVVEAEHLPDFAVIFERYYESRLAELPADRLRAAQLIIENGLLFAESATGDARRLSVDGAFLLQQFAAQGADADLLVLLERSYLVRREPNSLGGYNYEISHDTLIPPVRRAKFEREAEEERARLEQERVANLEKLQAEQRKRRRARRLAILMAVLAVVSLLALGFAAVQYQLARQRQQEAQDALSLFIQQKQEKEKLLVDEKIRKAEVFIGAGYPKAALEQLLDAEAIDSTNLEVQAKITDVRQLLDEK
ncbi:MAG: ATP-binding protein [Bacteroidetes bacterium]|nr:MAG: ATP-binding protein [Bacteroidota bacterium]